jgi:hypothetical protein
MVLERLEDDDREPLDSLADPWLPALSVPGDHES